MARRKVIDPDNPPTEPSDWVGAVVVRPPESRERPSASGGVVFHIFRASSDSAEFAITDRPDPPGLPPVPGGGTWQLFKRVPESGRPRIGFTEAEAKAGIAKDGWYRTSVRISEPDGPAVRRTRKPAAAVRA